MGIRYRMWMVWKNIPHLKIYRQIVADWFTSTFYKIFSNLYPNINLESRQFAKHNLTINK